MTALEAGSDIGGSIRNPAHFCGIYGHKPTWGIVPMRGHALTGALTPTDISVVGPLARNLDYTTATDAVSTDFIGARAASIVDGGASIVDGDSAILYVWYDNEFGYSRQVVRVLEELAGLGLQTFPKPLNGPA